MITGTCSLTERFRNHQETHGAVGETGATAYFIRLVHYLLQWESNTLDGDLMERAIYNALFAPQSPGGRHLRYYTAIDGPRKYHPADTYCCPGNWRRIVAEAVGKTKFDWTTLAVPVPDPTIRPDGLALELRAWDPSSDRNKPPDLTLLLTEYVDPTGEWTYFPSDDSKAALEDELFVH